LEEQILCSLMDYLTAFEEAATGVDLKTLNLHNDSPNDPWSAIGRDFGVAAENFDAIPKTKARKKHPSPSKKAQIVAFVSGVISGSGKGKLGQEANSKIMNEFNVGPQYARKLFKHVSKGGKITRKKGSGRKTSITPDKQHEIDSYLKERNYDATYREMEADLGIAKTTLIRFMRNNGYRTCGKYLRPILSTSQMEARFLWCQIHQEDSFQNTVDIDEKWMYSIYNRGSLKVPIGHTPKRQPIKSKRFVTKLMVMTAIAKPSKEHGFDGKIGIWCFAEKGKEEGGKEKKKEKEEILNGARKVTGKELVK